MIVVDHEDHCLLSEIPNGDCFIVPNFGACMKTTDCKITSYTTINAVALCNGELLALVDSMEVMPIVVNARVSSKGVK